MFFFSGINIYGLLILCFVNEVICVCHPFFTVMPSMSAKYGFHLLLIFHFGEQEYVIPLFCFLKVI
uniref:Uncharacterized protein n=1 Tax=Rhizophora mucronata TaxID=61149 RepID=A0A2P2IYQ9_RHIMU